MATNTNDNDRPKFEIEIDDETTLRRGDMVDHVEHGPMQVDGILVGAHHKTAELKSELGPIGLDLTDDDLREQWGETLHTNPEELREPGHARFENQGISVDGADIEVTVTTSGQPQDDAEAAHMHAVDQVVRALQAVRDETPPADCEGAGVSLDWDTIFADEEAEADE